MTQSVSPTGIRHPDGSSSNRVLGVLDIETGPAVVSLLHDEDDGTPFFNVGFTVLGEYVDLSLNWSTARALVSLITGAAAPAAQVTA